MPAKSIVRVIMALVPVVYCAGLAFYFFDVTGSAEGTWGIGLGPTVLGLGVIGLIFCIPLFIKLFRALSTPAAPKSDGQGGPKTPPRKDKDEPEFDADAAVARYLARRSAEAAVSPVPSSIRETDGPVKSSGFGQRR